MNLRPLSLLAAAATACALAACTTGEPDPQPAKTPKPGSEESAAQPAPERRIDFARDVRPVLTRKCLPCHNSRTLVANLNLESREKAMTPGPNGPFLVPYKPDQSLLYTATKLDGSHPKAMPATGNRIEPEEVETLRQWIAQGARWPDGPEGALTSPQEILERTRPESF